MKNLLFVGFIIVAICSCNRNEEKVSKGVPESLEASQDSYGSVRSRLDSILETKPNDVGLILERANLALKYYDYASAYSDAAKAFRLDSSNVDTRLVYALSIINQANRSVSSIRRAQRYLEIVIAAAPNNPKAMVGLANTYALQQDFDNAGLWIDNALQVSPKFFDAHVLKGSMFKVLAAALSGEEGSEKLSQAYMDSAIQAYSRVSQYYPNKAEIYLELGILFQQSSEERCIDYFYSAVELDPKNIDYKYALAYAYSLFDQERLAMRVYQEMQELDSLYSEAYCQMGQIYQKKYGQLDSALIMYREVVAIDPSHIDAFVNMGVIYEKQKVYKRALKSYAKALSILPEDRSPFMSLSSFKVNQDLARTYADELKTKL